MSVKTLRRFTKIILVVCNILIALGLLAGCYANHFDPLKSWYLGLFTLASFYFLVLLVAFIFFWFFAKPVFSLIGIIAIALAWMPLKNVVPFRFSSDFIMKKNHRDLRVMSWNVEHFDILEHKTHPEKKMQMLDMINEFQPDIACFQEMVASDSVPGAINYLPDFMKKLKMKDYHYSYNYKLDFDNKHRFGIIIFSKFPILNKQTISYDPHDYNSIFQYVDIVLPQDTFRIFNIHLQSLKFSADNRKYIDDPSLNDETDIKESKNILGKFKHGFMKRKIQSDRIREAIDQSPYPVIVCGDFNDVPNSYAYGTIGKGLKNAFVERGAGIGRTFYGISPTLRIDNIFADARCNIEQYVRIRKELSDHFPIIADLHMEH